MASLVNFQENTLEIQPSQRATGVTSTKTTTSLPTSLMVAPSSRIKTNAQVCSPQEETPSNVAKKSSGSFLSLVHEDVQAPVVGDVVKCGYLRKQKHGHKRFFVLRAQSHLGPARLEYYDSEKKFRNSSRSSTSSTGQICPPKRVIYLYQCFTVSRRADAKNKYLIALYTKDEYFAMVAESETEQESWYQSLTDLLNEGKDFIDSDELDENCGTLKPGTVFKEVWQVNVKPKGLGQTKNLTGVYRLCLSSKMIHLVKLNSDVPCVHLQLMNIRRCGHSDSFFFIEVGRSSSIGPGELWMQADDSVVAQNMHETILETMKAIKAFAEFRPRSKSQSSGTNPISFITTRRHLGNLPPSQTGLQRRSRTESMTGTPPTAKSNSYRFRTSSEGEGTMTRPFRSVTGSLVHLNTARLNLGRQEGSGRYVRAPLGSSYHARSASLPVSHFPSTTSPVSVSSSSGHGSASDNLTRPSSSSVCGSPSDGGFISSDEYGSSPGDLRYFRVRSNTPDSLGNTPPIREENCLSDYMLMAKHLSTADHIPSDIAVRGDYMEADNFSFRKRAHSLTKPNVVLVHQKTTQTTSSLDESNTEEVDSFGKCEDVTYSALPKANCDLDFRDCKSTAVQPLKDRSHSSSAKDDGYMPMMPGVASSLVSNSDYVPMNPKSPAAPKEIKSWLPAQVDHIGYMMMFPTTNGSLSCSPCTGYGSKDTNGRLINGEYMDMSHGNSALLKLPSNYLSSIASCDVPKTCSSYFSLPMNFKTVARCVGEQDNEYVPMSSPGKVLYSGSDYSNGIIHEGLSTDISAGKQSGSEEQGRTGSAARPTRLSLGTRGSNTIPRMCDRALPPEPGSPGEYINIDFGEKANNTPYSLSVEGSPSSLGSSSDHRQSPLSDYMSVDLDVQSPKATAELSSLTDITGFPRNGISRTKSITDYVRYPVVVDDSNSRSDDYTEMTFSMAVTPPRSGAAESDHVKEMTSPSSVLNRLCIVDRFSGVNSCLFPAPPPDISTGPKVIRADPQGRRRHSSETFSSTPTVTSSSSFFTDSSKRHSSASFDSVWLKPDEGIGDGQGSKMCRNTSTGFQNGLNYIALDLREDSASCALSTLLPVSDPLQNGTSDLDSGIYAGLEFCRSDGQK